jgi:hypothetical protein
LGKEEKNNRKPEKMHNEVLNNFYFSPNIFRMINSRGVGWKGHVEHMGNRRIMHTGFWWKGEIPRLRRKDNI